MVNKYQLFLVFETTSLQTNKIYFGDVLVATLAPGKTLGVRSAQRETAYSTNGLTYETN